MSSKEYGLIKPTIIYIHQYFSFPDSNAGTRSYDLSMNFIEKGYNVIVISGSGYIHPKYINKSGWNRVLKDGIDGYFYKMSTNNSDGFFRRALGFLFFMILSSSLVLRLKGDVVIATSTPLSIGLPALIKKFVHRTPFVFEVRDVWPDVPISMGILNNRLLVWLAKSFESCCYKYSTKIVALSIDMKRNIVQKIKQDDKVDVITNFANINRFTLLDSAIPANLDFRNIISKDFTHLILYCGTIGLVNSISSMVDLAFFMKKIDPSILFVCVGNGNEKNKVRDYAINKDVLATNFFLIDSVSKNKLPYLLKQASICSSWVSDNETLWANSANKFFDSLAIGKPILINHKGWQSTEINKYNIGIVLSHRKEMMKKNAEELYTYLITNDLENIGLNSKKLAIDKYSLRRASATYLEILNEIVYRKQTK